MRQAIAELTKEPIVASDKIGREKYSCPDCLQEVYLRRRANWADHFCHKPNSVCTTKLSISQETEEHKDGKKAICEWLVKHDIAASEKYFTRLFVWATNSNRFHRISLEKKIKVNDNDYRTVDVAVEMCSKLSKWTETDFQVVEAHECQLSPISIDGCDGLTERTRDYFSSGIESIYWWFGENSLTLTIQEWCDLFCPDRTSDLFLKIDSHGLVLTGYKVSREKFMLSNGNGNGKNVNNTISFTDFYKKTKPSQPPSPISLILECIPSDLIRSSVKDAINKAFDEDEFVLASQLCSAWNNYEKIKSPRHILDVDKQDMKRFMAMALFVLNKANDPMDQNEIGREIQDTFRLLDDDYKSCWFYTSENIYEKDSSGMFVSWRWLAILSYVLQDLQKNDFIATDWEYTDYSPCCITSTGIEFLGEIKDCLEFKTRNG